MACCVCRVWVVQPKPPKLAAVRATVLRAKRNGVDEAEYLDKHGLVLTDAKKAQLHEEMLLKAAARIEQMTPAALIGGAYHSGSWTAEDVRQGVLKLLRGMAADARTGKYISEGNTT